jgi:hypothetical protein
MGEENTQHEALENMLATLNRILAEENSRLDQLGSTLTGFAQLPVTARSRRAEQANLGRPA